MPITNSKVADIFNEVADLLEIEGANEFRVRAYRDAARTISGLPRSLREMLADGEDLTELPGIGDDLAGKIEEIVETGSLEQLAEIRARTPPSLGKMLNIAGLGPKRVQRIHNELGVVTLDELQEAAQTGQIRELHGLGPKIEEKILEDLEHRAGEEERTRLDVAEELVTPLVAYLEDIDAVQRVTVAGSYRRRKETVGDIDILLISKEGEATAAMDAFVAYEDVVAIDSRGETRSTVRLHSDLQVDVRVVPEESYGAALFYFTGSKAHNITLRNMALDAGLKVNEYGVFRDEERVAGRTEEEIYDLFDLDYIAPELREDRGELAAAQAGELPDLITLDDIRGDLQMHTTDSDGNASLEEMVAAARDLGHEYIAITDHSAHVGVVQGLDADALDEQLAQIAALNDDLADFRVLKGVEVDILPDGALALPDAALAKLDVVVASIHTKFGLSQEKQTERVLRALDNPHVNILAHPTGRRIGDRPPYEIDLERVMAAALERGCFLEINASPERLDLNDVYAKMAKEMGLKVVISTDAHRPGGLSNMKYGVWQARRGWLAADDVINTRPWPDLKKLLQR
ncbi:MAG: DNA polymerase/3'-5' exonuclease PolX [Anaerolineales bacterium]